MPEMCQCRFYLALSPHRRAINMHQSPWLRHIDARYKHLKAMDLERNLLEVSASALGPRHEPSPPKRLRLSEVSSNDDEAVPEWDCSAPYEQWLDYSAYANRHETPSLQSSSQESLDESDTHNDGDGEDGDDVEIRKNGNTTIMPTFFHPSMYT
jgi:hypothetical protein